MRAGRWLNRNESASRGGNNGRFIAPILSVGNSILLGNAARMSFGLDGPRLIGDSRGMDTALNMRVSTNGQKLASQDVELKRYCRRPATVPGHPGRLPPRRSGSTCLPGIVARRGAPPRLIRHPLAEQQSVKALEGITTRRDGRAKVPHDLEEQWLAHICRQHQPASLPNIKNYSV